MKNTKPRFALNDSTNLPITQLIAGDYVVVRQGKRNKWSTAYEPSFYRIFNICGSSIKARRTNDGREMCRDSSHFKLANAVVNDVDK